MFLLVIPQSSRNRFYLPPWNQSQQPKVAGKAGFGKCESFQFLWPLLFHTTRRRLAHSARLVRGPTNTFLLKTPQQPPPHLQAVLPITSFAAAHHPKMHCYARWRGGAEIDRCRNAIRKQRVEWKFTIDPVVCLPESTVAEFVMYWFTSSAQPTTNYHCSIDWLNCLGN